jgi:hypothetical protein
MNERAVMTPLTTEEWDIVCRLRDIPEGGLREQLLRLLLDLTGFAAAPACAEMQADGVPCASAGTCCDECQRIVACLAHLHRLVGAPDANLRT